MIVSMNGFGISVVVMFCKAARKRSAATGNGGGSSPLGELRGIGVNYPLRFLSVIPTERHRDGLIFRGGEFVTTPPLTRCRKSATICTLDMFAKLGFTGVAIGGLEFYHVLTTRRLLE